MPRIYFISDYLGSLFITDNPPRAFNESITNHWEWSILLTRLYLAVLSDLLFILFDRADLAIPMSPDMFFSTFQLRRCQ